MYDIGFINGKGLLGQKINKIHEDELQNCPIMYEKFILDRENDIPKINNDIVDSKDKKIEDVNDLSDLSRWVLVYNQVFNKNTVEKSKESVDLEKRANILENALQIVINNFNQLNNEFLNDIHITDMNKRNNINLINVYEIPTTKLSQKWQQILDYRNIFRRIAKDMDGILKNTEYLDGL